MNATAGDPCDTGALQAARRLYRYLGDTSARAGDLLPRIDRMQRALGIGQRPLREGMAILSAMGLIESRRKRGTVVRQPEIGHLARFFNVFLDRHAYGHADLVRARAVIEAAVGREACRCRAPDDLRAMRRAAARLATLPGKDPEYKVVDAALHLALLRAAHNPILEMLGHVVLQAFGDKPPRAVIWTPAGERRAAREHAAICRAVERRDAAALERVLTEHVLLDLKYPPAEQAPRRARKRPVAAGRARTPAGPGMPRRADGGAPRSGRRPDPTVAAD